MTDYTAADMLAQLVAGAQVVLPWIGAAVTAALLLFAAFFAIRTGFRSFREIVGGGRSDVGRWGSTGDLDDLSEFRSADGWAAADARVWQMYYDYDVSEGGSGTGYADARLARDRADRG